MEKLVRKALMDHLEENDIVTREQHGFVSGRSCITHLLEVMDSWTEVVDEGGSVDVIYTDFQKAFDSVPHRQLMRKVSAFGIMSKLLRWINDFLANRTQRVVINGEKSQEGNVTSGIPQGIVPGPILFVIYIDDLPANVKSQVKMFADDTKLFTRVGVPNNHETIQNDLDELMQWSNKWQLKFHPEKCCVLKLGRERETEYFMNSKDKDGNPIRLKLKEVQAEKDLGVTIDKVLSFKRHVELAASKANRVIGVIRRSFDYLTTAIFVPGAVQGTSQATPGVRSLCVEPRREESERSLRWGGKDPEEGNQTVGPSKGPPIPWTSTSAEASMSGTQEKEGRRNRSLQVPTRILQSVTPGLPHCPERDEIHQR